MNEKSSMPYILIGCGVLLLVVMCAGAGFAVYALRSGMFQPNRPATAGTRRTIRASVTSASGLPGVAVGSPCALTVDLAQRQDGTLWCQGNLQCGGVGIYGTAEGSGYFNCAMTQAGVTGEDTGTTASDSDPMFSVDTHTALIRTRDDGKGALGAFSLEAHIDQVQ